VEYCLLALDRRRPDRRKFHSVQTMKTSARPKKPIKSKLRTALSIGRPLSCFAARSVRLQAVPAGKHLYFRRIQRA
jgi:hypothetical protein